MNDIKISKTSFIIVTVFTLVACSREYDGAIATENVEAFENDIQVSNWEVINENSAKIR